MSRSVPFRRTVSDAVSWRQDQAHNATIYILRETGPTGFLLKEEGETKKFKVYLGDPHTCTCPVYKKERDLCKHICWVLLKKFRIPRTEAESFQLGLVEREINALLRGRTEVEAKRGQSQAKQKDQESVNIGTGGREILAQREITEEDVCPICQDEFLATREPVTYCRFGCAKSIHIKCMKVWAEHQGSTGEETIKCPLCREDFGQIEFLQKVLRNSSLQKTQAERGVIYRGVVCSQCNQSPIAGRCYRCIECRTTFLCQECYSCNAHSQHEFQYRQKPNQRWRPAQRSSGGVLPVAVLEDLQNRELQDEDYELLLQLDSGDSSKSSSIPVDVIRSFPTETVREGGALSFPGVQCRVCLRGFTVGEIARRLPCRHKFHKDCIDQWLLHQHPTCPVDGTVVWNPLTANLNNAGRNARRKKKKDDQQNQESSDAGHGSMGVISGRRIGVPGGQKRTGPAPLSDGAGAGTGIDALPAQFQLLGLGISSGDGTTSSHSRPAARVNGQQISELHSSPHFPSNHHSGTIDYSSPTSNPHDCPVIVRENLQIDSSPSSRASWLSGDSVSNSQSPERDVNDNINLRVKADDSISNGTVTGQSGRPRHKPPSGSRAHQTRNLHIKNNHDPLVPSVRKLNDLVPTANGYGTRNHGTPSLSERGVDQVPAGSHMSGRPGMEFQRRNNLLLSQDGDIDLEPIARRFGMSNSAPVLSERGSVRRVPHGIMEGTTGRGRAESGRQLLTRTSKRARSSSIGRRKSTNHSRQLDDTLEESKDVFLGSPPVTRVAERAQRCRLRRDSRPPRSTSLPRTIKNGNNIELVLSGYNLDRGNSS